MHLIRSLIFAALLAATLLAPPLLGPLLAQEDAGTDDELEQGLFEDAERTEEAAGTTPVTPLPLLPIGPQEDEETDEDEGPRRVVDRATVGGAGEGQTSWDVSITVAVMMNYVFSDSPDSFTAKYRFEITGKANAATAILRGDADISADVEGPLSRWPTGECRLSISVPKVPYELTFRRTGDEKSNMKLLFRRAISEDWKSTCTFTDAPGSVFETRGAPETWLSRALEMARPPLKDLIADIGEEERSSQAVIPKEVISDPPLGNVELEGRVIVTVRPGGAE